MVRINIAMREAGEADLDGLIAIDGIAQHNPDRARQLSGWIAGDTCIVAEVEGDLAGYAVLDYSFYQRGFVPMVYVEAERRRQGVGAALLRELESRCRTKKLFTSTNRSNQPMQSLLAREGYVRCGHIDQLDPGDPELIFVKILHTAGAEDRDADENLIDRYRDRMVAASPDLKWQNARVNSDGLMNDVIVVDDAVVFRFPKSQQGRQMLAKEGRLLPELKAQLPVDVPDPFHIAEDMMAYRMLPGRMVANTQFQVLSSGQRQRAADQVALFLSALHAIQPAPETPPASSPNTLEAWSQIRALIEEYVQPLLMSYQRAWVDRLFRSHLDDPEFFGFAPTMVHGDLAFSHLLFDSTDVTLTGVIDWGAAGAGDPAIDLAALIIAWGESFVRLFEPHYPHLPDRLHRARFYAQAIELMWTATGRMKGDDRWFAAHLGGARDIALPDL